MLNGQAQLTFIQVAGGAGDQANIGGAKDGGCAFADYDRDGDLDMLVNTNVNAAAARSYLLRNDNGIYTDVTSAVAPGLKSSLSERAASWGDCNRDGYPDILVNTNNRVKVLRNDSGTSFTTILDITTMTDGMNTEGAGWLDYDNDGDLDFFVECHNFGVDLFNNNGATPTPTFTQVTINSVGAAGTGAGGLGLPEGGSGTGDYASTVDLNADGYVDIIARRENSGTNNGLDLNPYDIFYNQGNGSYAPLTSFNEQTDNSNKGGVSTGDFDNDGDFDILWTSASSSGNRAVIYEQTGYNSGNFSLVANPFRLDNNSLETATDFDGTSLGDIDNDGDLDVFMTQNSGTSKLYLNLSTGPGNFSFRQPGPTWLSGAAINYGINVNGNGEGCVFVDYDNDGDLDLYVNRNGATNQGWRNNYIGSAVELTTYQNSYLRVIPLIDIGAGFTSPAINATVRLLDCAGNSIGGIREVSGGDGHGTQQTPWLHFGLKHGADWTYLVEVTFTRNGTTPVVVRKAVRPSDIAPFNLGSSSLTLEQTIIVKNTDANDIVGCTEICDNGIDDDGDGLIDSYDSDCFTSMVPICGTTGISDYYGVLASCQYPVPTDPFSLVEIWASQANSQSTSRSFALAGDLDGDCLPEAVFTNEGNEYGSGSLGIIIADGATGLTKTLISDGGGTDFSGSCGIALADVDRDGNGDILFYDRNGAILRYEWDGTTASLIYKKTTTDGVQPLSRRAANGYSSIGNYKLSSSIADINHDGIPELVIGNQVFNANTGAEICAGVLNDPVGSKSDRINTSVLVDVIGDSNLDLVVGNAVYRIAIPSGSAYGSGTITKAVNMASASPSIPGDGYVAIADMDEDGDLDVVSIVGSTMYVWDPSTGTVLGSQGLPGSGDGTSPTIGDVDNVDPDGAGPRTRDMEILFHRDNGVYVVKFNPVTFAFTTIASAASSDGSETTISLFDFQGDGKVDILYRDQNNLRMLSYNGTATLQEVVAAVPCPSSTAFEHPMAVDITGDGQTELVCDCDGKIKAFGSSNANVPLIPSRKVWNQWSYFVVNINDDLTVPLYQQDHSVNMGINAFWQQLPLWDPLAASPIRASADVILTINSVTCTSGTPFGTVSFEVENQGEGTFASGSYVSFYDGDPTLAGSIFLGRFELIETLGANETENASFVIDAYPAVDLYAVVNDDGTAALPYTSPSSTNLECDYSNNTDTYSPMYCLPSDNDSDGIPDFEDLDDDNDGIHDTDEQDCPPTVAPLNSGGYALNTDFSSSPPLAGMGAYSSVDFDFDYELVGSANWSSGVRVQNQGGLLPDGDYINLQPNNTDLPAGDFARYIIDFSEPVTRVRFKWGGLDVDEQARFSAYLNGQVIHIDQANITNINIPTADFSYVDDQTVVSSSSAANAPNNAVLFSLDEPVDSIIIEGGKGGSSTGNSTTQLFELEYCILIDTDGDGVYNHIDLDSDNDGIFDLVEADHSGPDLNNDGVIDGAPVTFGSNGLFNSIETSPDSGTLNYVISDSDSDGNIDSIELDSDNDGCNDVIEAGFLDPDGNGILGD